MCYHRVWPNVIDRSSRKSNIIFAIQIWHCIVRILNSTIARLDNIYNKYILHDVSKIICFRIEYVGIPLCIVPFCQLAIYIASIIRNCVVHNVLYIWQGYFVQRTPVYPNCHSCHCFCWDNNLCYSFIH